MPHNSSLEHKLSGGDVRAIVRLLGEVVVLKGSPTAKKQLLMDGLCRLVGADFWVWSLCVEMTVGGDPVYVNFQNGGFRPGQLPRHIEAIEHPQIGEILIPFAKEFREKRTQLTRSLCQFDPEDRMNQLEIGTVFKEADIGTVLLSHRPVDDKSSSSIGIFRRVGRPKFTEREVRIAHILLTEVPWLHEQGWPADRGVEAPSLSRRERIVMNLLTEGHNRRQIAEGLKLSEHTVNQYVKSVYKHFGVSSHAGLLRRLTVGDGGDRADDAPKSGDLRRDA